MASLYPTAAPRAGGAERSEHGQAARSEAPEADSGAASAAPGLVTSAISGRVSETTGQRHVFRTLDECGRGAAALGTWAWDGHEGPIPQVEVYPGVIRLTAPNLARRESALNRRLDRPAIPSEGEPEDGRRGEIRGWSRKSRARMVSTLAELDWAPLLSAGAGLPAMVTLTYPGDWEAVAGDGEQVKRHFQTFLKRFERAWGEQIVGVWKLEFQRRGAAHFHILMCPPTGRAGAQRQAEHAEKIAAYETGLRQARPRWRPAVGDGKIFRDWLSAVWADIVAHPDTEQRKRHELAGTAVDYAEGDRVRDPKRAAVYFGKHGAYSDKEYQNVVPKLWQESGRGPGRFWGVRGLKRVRGVAMVSAGELQFLGRQLRKLGTRTRAWSPERGHYVRPAMRTVWRERRARSWRSPAGVTILRWRKRRTSVRVRRMTGPNGAGFLLVNDGVEVARQLARARDACLKPAPAPVGMRGPVDSRLP